VGSLVYTIVLIPDIPMEEMAFQDWGQLTSSALSQLLVLAGVLLFRRSRLRAYRLFDAAVLISIFFTQFFDFLEHELSAIGGLFLSLILHAVLRYLIEQERALRAGAAAEASATAAEVPATAS
jgi:uncharacterized membrane-anchored protein